MSNFSLWLIIELLTVIMSISFLDCSSGAKRYRGTNATFGVHNTNFYEVEGQARINPVEGLEMDSVTYAEVQV